MRYNPTRLSIPPRRRPLCALALLAAIASTPSFAATTDFWNAGSGEWTNSANWLTAPFPNAVDSLAIFESAPISPTIITVASPVTIGSLLLDSPNSYRFDSVTSGSLTFASTTGTSTLLMTAAGTAASTLTLSVNLANTLAISNNSTAPLAFTGTLTGTGNLILNGHGEVDLRGSSNTWTPANIFVNAGTLSTLNGTIASLGNINSGTVTIANGAQIDFSGIVSTSTASQFTKTVVLGGSGVPPVQATLASLNTSAATSSLMGAVILNGGGIFNTRSSAILNIGDPTGLPGIASLSGIGPLIKVGTGLLAINIPATFTGGTSITAGTLTINSPGSLVGTGEIGLFSTARLNIYKPAGTSPATASVSPNSINMSGGVLAIQSDISLANIFSPNSTSGIVSLETGGTMTFGGSNASTFPRNRWAPSFASAAQGPWVATAPPPSPRLSPSSPTPPTRCISAASKARWSWPMPSPTSPASPPTSNCPPASKPSFSPAPATTLAPP